MPLHVAAWRSTGTRWTSPLTPLPSLSLYCSQAASHFRLLGRAVAKALQDGRLLDLPLSPVFYRLALGRRCDLYDIRGLDAALGALCTCYAALCTLYLLYSCCACC